MMNMDEGDLLVLQFAFDISLGVRRGGVDHVEIGKDDTNVALRERRAFERCGGGGRRR